MNRRLSSILVPVYKLFPLLAILMALLSIPNWISHNFSKDFLGGFAFLFVWGGLFYLFTFRWKIVRLQGDKILVSDFFHKIEIPLSQVRSVEASSWWSWQPRTITIRLKAQTKFGNEIVFVPRGLGFSATALVNELKRLVSVK